MEKKAFLKKKKKLQQTNYVCLFIARYKGGWQKSIPALLNNSHKHKTMNFKKCDLWIVYATTNVKLDLWAAIAVNRKKATQFVFISLFYICSYAYIIYDNYFFGIHAMIYIGYTVQRIYTITFVIIKNSFQD